MSEYKKVVSFSGGRTSAFLCIKMLEKYGRDHVDFVFMDTGAEHPLTYEFVRNVNKHYQLDLTCLRLKLNPQLGKGNTYTIVDVADIKPDLKPFKDMTTKYGVPYIGGMFCTDRMKLTPYKKYCDETYGRNNYETWLGIRQDEPARLHQRDGIRYLAEISDAEKVDILDFWKGQPFDLEIDEWLGNCVFCPKKSNLKLAAAHRDVDNQIYVDFIDTITSQNVRVDDNTGHYSRMYRGKQSLESLIKNYEMFTRDEIVNRIRSTKKLDTGSCSESCEVFNDETYGSD